MRAVVTRGAREVLVPLALALAADQAAEGHDWMSQDFLSYVWTSFALMGLINSVFNVRDASVDEKYRRKRHANGGRRLVNIGGVIQNSLWTVFLLGYLVLGGIAIFHPHNPEMIGHVLRFTLVAGVILISASTSVSRDIRDRLVRHFIRVENGDAPRIEDGIRT